MGTLVNQSFKSAKQDAMTTVDPKMPNMGGSMAKGPGNMIGSGGAGEMSASRGGNMSRAVMGSGRVPFEGNTNSTGTKRSA